MLITSWLGRLTRTFECAFSKSISRRTRRRHPTALRFLTNSQIECLEDRALLSAVVGASIDVASHRLLIFDPSTGTQTGLVTIPNSSSNSDIVISPDGTFAYVSNFNERQIYVVDLGTKALATGVNPIPVATQAEDLAITPDGKYLLVVDGSGLNPIVVVDTATRATASTLSDGIGHSAVDVTAAGDVLVGTVNNGTTRRYLIDGAGQLSFTGQTISNGGQNVTAAPNGVTAIEAGGSAITSFAISGMSPTATVSPGGNLQSFALSPDGSKLYVRTSTSVLGYGYNQTSGAIGSLFLNVSGLAQASGFFGTEQLDVTPDGTRLFVSAGTQVLALDALSGANLGNITLANAAFVGMDIAAPSGTGTVTGTKFNDLNGNGLRDSAEPGLAGWVIYADLNNDKTREIDEPFATTDSTGNYTLSLSSGAYTLREEPQTGWIQTSPQPGLFATGNNGTSLISLNPATGSGSTIGTFGANVTATFAGAFTPDGTFWTITNAFDASLSRLAKVNLTTGVATPVGNPNWSGAPIVALEADAAGNLYAGNFNGTFYSVNQTTGQLTALGSLGFGQVKDFTYDNNGTLWAVGGNHLYQVNPSNGATTPGPTITGTNAEVQGIMVDPLTGIFYAATYTSSSQFYTINTSTGAATPIGSGVGIAALNGGDFMPLSANRGLAVTISANQTVSGRDFGNIADQGTVTGTKFDDLNKDGVRNSGEPGLPGWVIYADLNNDGTRESSEPFTTTDSNGNYSLSIASGTYSVREEPQAGWVQTSPRPGLFSTGNNGTSLITINPATGSGSVVGSFGANIITTFAGAFTPDGTYWTISNAFDASLARLAKVNLSTGAVTTVGSPNWSGAPIVALEADATGNLFAGNFNGVFYSVNQATGELTAIGNLSFSGVKDFTFDNNGTLWAVSANQLYQVNPGSGNAIPGPTITGTNAEVQGIMVDPLSGTFYASTYTGTSRLYTIDLTTGVATPVGPGIGIGALNGGDFMPLSANRGLIVTISAGKTFAGRDFGNLLDQGTVTGTKYNDLNGNGVRDGGEPGLPGWIVYADLDNDNTRDGNEPFATTDSTGAYSLSIPSGVYTLREEPQAGWVQTAPQPGLFASANNGTSLITINPATGSSVVVGTFASQTKYAGAFTPDGKFWTIINQSNFGALQLATVNLSTGAAVPVGTPIVTSPFITALEADASGNLFGCDSNGNFCLMNQTTGQPVLIGNLGFSGITDLTFDNSGELWAVGGTQLYEINPISGTAIPGPAISGVNGQVMGIMVDPLTGIFYATTYGSNSLLYTVDTTTGVATQVGLGLGNNFSNSGDFVPLLANRGISVTVSAGAALSGRDFGNKVANTPPAITSAATASVPENSNEVIQVTASDSDVPTQSITFAIAGGDDADKFTIDVTTGALSFITAPNFEVPTDADGSNVYNVTVKATDSGTPSLLATQAIAVTVTDLNEAPTIVSSSSTSVAENSTAVLTVLASDEDQPAQSITFAIAGGDDADKFTIDATTGALSFITAPNFEVPADADGNNVYNVTVKAIDSGTPSLFTTQAIAVTVTDLNEAPTIVSSSSTSVAENSTAVLTVLASDEDLPAQSITFAIAGGDDADKFTIDATTGALSFITAPNFEVPTDSDGNNVYNVTVKAADSGTPSLFATQAIAVTVTDLNEAPTIVSSFSTSVAENSTAVLTVLASDEDQPAQSIRFAISGGDDAGKFTIDSTTGALSFITAPNFEVPTDANGNNVYNVTVKATDGGTPSLFATQAIAVTVTDLNEAPTIVSSSSTSVAENSTAVLTVLASDEDQPAQSIRFAISGGDDAGKFTIDATTGALSFITAPNFEVPTDANGNNVYNVTVKAIDSGTPSMFTSQAIAVTVTDVNAAIVSLMKLTDGAEGSTPSVGIFRVTQSSVSASDTVVHYTITGSASGGIDYTALSGTVTIPTGQTTADINVTVLDDAIVEGTETVVLTLSSLGVHDPETTLDVTPSRLTAAINILDDDVSTLTISSPTVTEGNVGTSTMTFTVTSPNAVPGGFTVGFNVANLTTQSNDYSVVTTSPLTFSGTAGETRTITLNVIGDINSEANETLSVTLGAVVPGSPAVAGSIISGAVGTGTIVNDDVVTFSVSDAVASESAGVLTFNLVADKAFDTDTTMTVTFTDITATGGGVDYTGTSQQVTFLAGQKTKTVSVALINDTVVEATETFSVALSASTPLNGRLINVTDTGTGTITDNDSATVSIAKVTDGAESNIPVNGSFKVTQTAASSTDTVVNYTIAGTATPGAGKDYQTLSGTVTIPAGQTSAVISVNVLNDDLVESSETVTVTFSSLGAHDPDITLNSSSQNRTATLNITDNDGPTFTSPAAANVPENTSTSTVVLDVNVDTSLAPGFTITYSLSGPDAALFKINVSTGQITFRSSPNFEAPADQDANNKYQLTVTASANTSPVRTSSQDLTITVTPVNDITPVFVNASPTFSLPENSAVGTLVGTVSATDGDQPPQTLTYSITSGNSTGAFTINSLTGQITVANSVPLDFEATNRFTLTVQVSDNGTPAARTANATVVVNLTNVAEPPTITIPTPSTSYTFGSQYAFLAPNSSFAYGDVTNPNFNGAKLTVSIVTGRLANDVLGIVSAGTGSNQINTKNGNKLYLGSTQIGTFTGGSGSSPNLVVTFNSSATVAAVGKLLQQLSLQTNGSVGSTRTVNFQIKGIGGVDSNVAAHDITVVP